MSDNEAWQVTVTREGKDWLAEVHGIRGGAHTDARSLRKLDEYVREIIVLGADLPDEVAEDLAIEYTYRVGFDAEREQVTMERVQARRLAETVERHTARLVREYVAAGMSVRDVADLLHISYQRVSQITAGRNAS